MKKSQHLMIRRAVEIIALLLSGYIGDRFGQRILASCGGMVVGLVYGGGEGGKTKKYFSTFNFIDSQRQNSICLLIIYAN
jgi:hypothetical protein